MGVIGRLNDLDERAGARGPLGTKRWDARLRLWWLPVATAYAVCAVAVAYAALNDGSVLAALPIALLACAFYSGFLYNERVRQLGTRPRLLEVPQDWGNAPSGSPSAQDGAERDVLTA